MVGSDKKRAPGEKQEKHPGLNSDGDCALGEKASLGLHRSCRQIELKDSTGGPWTVRQDHRELRHRSRCNIEDLFLQREKDTDVYLKTHYS